MPQLGIPRITRHTFIPSRPSSELFALVTRLSEQVGTKRAEFLIERLLDDQDAVVVSGWALALAWHAAHELAAVDASPKSREGNLFRSAALSCARWVNDVAMSTGEATTTTNVPARLTGLTEAINKLERAQRATDLRKGEGAAKTKNRRLEQLDRLVARIERLQEIAPRQAIRELFKSGKMDMDDYDYWLRENAKDKHPRRRTAADRARLVGTLEHQPDEHVPRIDVEGAARRNAAVRRAARRVCANK